MFFSLFFSNHREAINMEAKIDRLVAWARENGAFIDERISFKFSQDKGVYATLTSDVSGSESLIRVPDHLVIGSQLSQEILPNFHYESQESFSGNEVTLLTISRLAFDSKFSECRFQPYIDILSRKLDVPYFWNEEEKKLLDGTDCDIFLDINFKRILDEWYKLILYASREGSMYEHRNQMEKDILFYKKYIGEKINPAELHAYLNEANDSWTSFRNYLWSYSTLTSRGFPGLLVSGSHSDAGKHTAILVPIFDLLNHRNGCKVRWSSDSDQGKQKVVFQVNESLKADDELVNNYGDKANVCLLLNYGFVQDGNEFDKTTLSLRIGDTEVISGAYKLGIRFYDEDQEIRDFDSLANGINFELSVNDPLPNNLVDFFSYLTQLRFEKRVGMTLRMRLDGLTELRKILDAKIAFFKHTERPGSGADEDIVKMVKVYKKGQRLLFQKSVDSLQTIEKNLLKVYKPDILSFKIIMKNDIAFVNSLKEAFKVGSYEDILNENRLNEIVTLWLVRVSNRDEYKDNFFRTNIFKSHIDYIKSQFREIEASLDITEEDIEEWKYLVTSYVSRLRQTAPDIYSKGKWDSEIFVVAGTVMDRVSYLRPTNNEMFFIQMVDVGLSKN